MDSGYANGYFCKKNIEEEEAEEEARVRSMLPEDPPHPLLSLHTPSPEVLLQVQPDKKEAVDVSGGGGGGEGRRGGGGGEGILVMSVMNFVRRL